MDVTSDKAAKKVAAAEANRLRQQERYANDPEYRERLKAANREDAAKRRAAERERRQAALASGEIVPGKPGRPRRQPDDRPVPRKASQDVPA
jgi:hypothetical protein